ncbi:hypothetical protein L1049_013070 [Liquidambar formosana]|uniref:Mitochondrial 28S ribosomal protein S34 n=1 Tax=Liquidambar formosana TaxID=63359 RepID=A0AAP0RNW5_LIQFO
MATTFANRVASLDRPVNLLRLSFNFLRSFSTSSTPSSTNPSATAASKKPKRKKKKNLFEVAHFLPNWGIGYHMAKTHWTGVSYQITKINLYKDGKHGKAWGIVHKDGLPAAGCCQENKWGSQTLLEVHSTLDKNTRKRPKT